MAVVAERRPKKGERLRMVAKEACYLWNDYRDYFSCYQEQGKLYCLPPSLVSAFERLGETIRAADLSIADIERET